MTTDRGANQNFQIWIGWPLGKTREWLCLSQIYGRLYHAPHTLDCVGAHICKWLGEKDSFYFFLSRLMLQSFCTVLQVQGVVLIRLSNLFIYLSSSLVKQGRQFQKFLSNFSSLNQHHGTKIQCVCVIPTTKNFNHKYTLMD